MLLPNNIKQHFWQDARNTLVPIAEHHMTWIFNELRYLKISKFTWRSILIREFRDWLGHINVCAS